MNKLYLLGLISLTLFGCARDDRPTKNPHQGPDYDNTRVNVRDRDPRAKTSFDQAENERDLTISQKIRHAIVADDSLSYNAKNIKIITENGVVILRGPVASPREKSAILNKVNQISGIFRVEDQLDIERNP